MIDEDEHAEVVDVWRLGVAELPPAAVLTAFERAFAAVWRRLHTTLGDVTLTAIGDRVFHDAIERFPNLYGCKLQPDGLDVRELRGRVDDGSIELEELTSFTTFALREFLSVIGVLTAEVLTPALHRQLLASNVDEKDALQ